MRSGQESFGEGRPGYLKAITSPPQGSGNEGPAEASEVSFFKTFQSIKNESIFQKYQHFSGQKSIF